MDELQTLFGEAIQEHDFATSAFAKMKLKKLLTFENIGLQQSTSQGPTSSSGNSTQQIVLNVSPDQLIELLKNEQMFGTTILDEGAKNENKMPVEATKLAIKMLSEVFKNPNIEETAGHPQSPSFGVLRQLVGVVAGKWMGANDVGVGSSAASAINGLLSLLARSLSKKQSDTESSGGQVSALDNISIVIETSLAAYPNDIERSEAGMRLLDSISQLFIQQQNREVELGNRVGLPTYADTSLPAEIDQKLTATISSLASHTKIIDNFLRQTNSALKATISEGGGEEEADNAIVDDPLALINLISVAGVVGRFVPSSSSSVALVPFIAALSAFIVALPQSPPMASLVAPFVLRGAATLMRNHSTNFSIFLQVSSFAAISKTFDFISGDAIQLIGPETVEAFIDFSAALIAQSETVMSDLASEAKVTAGSIDQLCALYLGASSFSHLLFTKLLLPTKPVSADLKASALLCVAAVVSSPLFSRVSGSTSNNGSVDLLGATITVPAFNNSIFPHKTSLDDTVRRACWHTLVAVLQHPSLRGIAAPSTAAHLAGLAASSYAEAVLEVRRSQLQSCDLLLKMPEMAPFHAKLQSERKSGIYSKSQESSVPTVGSAFAY